MGLRHVHRNYNIFHSEDGPSIGTEGACRIDPTMYQELTSRLSFCYAGHHEVMYSCEIQIQFDHIVGVNCTCALLILAAANI